MGTLKLFLIMAILVLAACSDSGNGNPDLLQRTARAMGGSAAIQAVQTEKVVASGNWFEPEQTFRPGDDPPQVSDFTYTLTQDLAPAATDLHQFQPDGNEDRRGARNHCHRSVRGDLGA